MRNKRYAAAASLAFAAIALIAAGARFFNAGSARGAGPAPGAPITKEQASAPSAGPADPGTPAPAVAAARPAVSGASQPASLARKVVVAPSEAKAARPETLKGRIRERMSETSRGPQGGEGPIDGYANWFYGQRAYPAQSIPRNALAKALESAIQVNGGLRGGPGEAAPDALFWTPLGPDSMPDGQTDTGAGATRSPVSGRVSAIAVHPTNNNIVYAAGAQGGVWKTTNALSATPAWSPLTDHQPSLAVGDIAIDPVNPNIIYVGTGEANGSCDSYYGRGILRSIDGGANWTQLGGTPGGPFDTQSISRILIDPATAGSATTTTLWASTALAFISSGTSQCTVASSLWNGAVWRSTDSGANWTLQNVPTGAAAPNFRIHDMALDPVNADILYVAVRPQSPTLANGGVWKSVNARAVTPAFVKVATGFPDTATASPGIRRITLGIGGTGAPGTLYASLESAPSFLWGMYKTTNGGATWTHLQAASGTGTGSGTTITATTGTFATDGSWIGRRIILNNLTSAIITSVANSTHLSVNMTVAGSFSWSTGSYPGYCDGQCFYDMTIGVDPTDATASRVYVGGNPQRFANSGAIPLAGHSVWRSTDGGANWTPVSQGSGTGGLHVDDHKIAFDPSTTPARVYDGNDGGIWRSNDSGASWVTMNTNIAITQFQSVALHPSNKAIVLGGTQDNGTDMLNSALQPPPKWFHADDGDGGAALIDQSTPARMFHTYFNQQGNFMGPAKNTTGGSGTWTFVGAYFGYGAGYYNGMGPTDPVSFYAPMASHPAFTPNVVYFGSSKLYRATDPVSPFAHVASWTVKSPALAGASQFLSAIGVLPNLVAGKEVIYTGASDGRISVSSTVDGTGAVPSWATISGAAPLPLRFVTEIEVDRGDATGNTAIAAFSGFNTNTPTAPGHVFRTLNGLSGAATWTNISGDLPDLPVNAIAIDHTTTPHALYAGTDIGVFQSLNSGTNWTYLSTGHPVVSVFGLDRNAGTGQIVSSTHGRGMFELMATGTGTSYFTVDPCRVADTRNPPGPSGGPALGANTNRSFPVLSLCGIPPTATAVAVNLAVFFPSEGGDLRVYPTGGAVPLASALNFRAGIVRANNAIVPIGAGGMISIQCDMAPGSTGSTNFFFDVFGYFQ